MRTHKIYMGETFLKRQCNLKTLVDPRGWTWHIYRQGSADYCFWVLNFENLYFLYWSNLLYFFELSNKCCIFKCFMSSTVFFRPNSIHQVLLSSHGDVKIKKSNSECKMSSRNAVFQFRVQNIKAQYSFPLWNKKCQGAMQVSNSECKGAMQFSNSECKMSRRNAVYQFEMLYAKVECSFPVRNAKCQGAMQFSKRRNAVFQFG